MTHPKLRKLHGLLQKALEVELFTIPPYLTALYSIDEGANRASVEILQSVVMEEMLHAALVSNIMTAVGAAPQVQGASGTGKPRRVNYPAQAPHVARPLVIGLLPFSEKAVKGFAEIELPEDRTRWTTGAGFYSIGQLYDRIRNLMIAVTDELGADQVFTGAPRLQLSAKDYYGAGGELMLVSGLDSALAAIDEIAQQGEGACTATSQATRPGSDSRRRSRTTTASTRSWNAVFTTVTTTSADPRALASSWTGRPCGRLGH